MKSFRDFIFEEKITHENFREFKQLAKNQPGFFGWSFKGDYEILTITYKNKKQAKEALDNINKNLSRYIKMENFGDISLKDNKIIVELNEEGQKALSSD